MPTTPWTVIRQPEPGREYLALLSYLPLLHYRHIPKFVHFTLETQRQLGTAAGLIGYSLDAQLFRKRFWTLSVWDDRDRLMNFVRAAPHSRIMRDLAPHMDKTRFAQWKVAASELPLSWPDAKARLA
jgi:hypothetical protein